MVVFFVCLFVCWLVGWLVGWFVVGCLVVVVDDVVCSCWLFGCCSLVVGCDVVWLL